MTTTDKIELEIKSSICKEAFERFPFGVIFSKTAPSNLDQVSYDDDFCYYYFSPGFEKRCGLKRVNMCVEGVNAKRDFPADHEQYFTDDIEVMKIFKDGNIKSFCEPWSPPGVVGPIRFVYTRKTALKIANNKSFMLGSFTLIDDLVLGNVNECNILYDASSELPVIAREIPDSWFLEAFTSVPLGLAIYCFQKQQSSPDPPTILTKSNLWDIYALECETEITRLTSSINNDLSVNTARLHTNSSGTFNVGMYGVTVQNAVYWVVMLRPAMRDVCDPYYVQGGELVKRG
jgi:hypothetical protein